MAIFLVRWLKPAAFFTWSFVVQGTNRDCIGGAACTENILFKQHLDMLVVLETIKAFNIRKLGVCCNTKKSAGLNLAEQDTARATIYKFCLKRVKRIFLIVLLYLRKEAWWAWLLRWVNRCCTAVSKSSTRAMGARQKKIYYAHLHTRQRKKFRSMSRVHDKIKIYYAHLYTRQKKKNWIRLK